MISVSEIKRHASTGGTIKELSLAHDIPYSTLWDYLKRLKLYDLFTTKRIPDEKLLRIVAKYASRDWGNKGELEHRNAIKKRYGGIKKAKEIAIQKGYL